MKPLSAVASTLDAQMTWAISGELGRRRCSYFRVSFVQVQRPGESATYTEWRNLKTESESQRRTGWRAASPSLISKPKDCDPGEICDMGYF
ncbi:hypothetical protein NEOLEDRAFT_1137281 [Neolentinus lepideus HHB14362 ss-1]|uniref:Uncharacterized protein n=1 Tax=Neolentinus lepideus HHB14362 ss-1 TaxID=1314782 RepID=A0A165QVG9_9AGAM|nr:hypothetical protein NEOLEDRAFT_1137281 [Neolentinus lepideus HHB14362 ss-1]